MTLTKYRFSFPESYHFISNPNVAIDLLDLSLHEAAQLKSRVAKCTHTLDLTLNKTQSFFHSYHAEQAAFFHEVLNNAFRTQADRKPLFKYMFYVLEVQNNGNLHCHVNVDFTVNAFHDSRLLNLRKHLSKLYKFDPKGMYCKPIRDAIDRRNYLFKCRTKHPKYIFEYNTVTPSDDGVSRAE